MDSSVTPSRRDRCRASLEPPKNVARCAVFLFVALFGVTCGRSEASSRRAAGEPQTQRPVAPAAGLVKPNTRPAARLVVVGIFKDEAENLPEWLHHYLVDEGAAAMLLIDNNSTDDWRAAVAPYGDRVRVKTDARRHAQRLQYGEWYRTLKREFENDWVLAVDLDEYMFAHSPAVPLAAAVRDVLDPGKAHAVKVPWTSFGSSGRARQPKNGAVCGFTMRRRYPGSHMVKEFARVRVLVRLGIHVHQTSPDWNEYNRKRTRVSYSEDDLAGAPFHLNHYPIQSREYFARTKMSRGDVNNPKMGGIRTWEYFDAYDYKDVEDTELATRKDCARVWHPDGAR